MSPSRGVVPLQSLAKAYTAKSGERREVFRPTTVALPTDRRLAVLGQRRSGKTTLLRILSGKLRSDVAQAMPSAQFSPVVNFGGLFHPKLNVHENVRFLADLYGIDADRFVNALFEVCEPGLDRNVVLNSNDPAIRRSLEVAAIMCLPYRCYLIDDAGFLSSELLDRCFEVAALRRAGTIFATSNGRIARQRADAVLVIADKTLHLFADIEEGIEFFARQRP